MDVVALGLAKADAKVRYGGRVQNWARNFISGPTARFGTMTSPPTITFGGNASSVNASYTNGTVMHNPQSTLMTSLGSIFTPTLFASTFPYQKPGHITTGAGVKSGGNSPLRVRFQTDATAIDFAFVDALFSQFAVIVDGQYVKRDRTAVFGNSGNVRYIKCDFGADTVTYSRVGANLTINAGGTGHVVGDVITMDGGTGSATGTPFTVKVAQVTATVVTAVDVVNKGAYNTQPVAPFNQVSTTGTGTGLQLGGNFYHPEHTTRKIRTIELVYSEPATFLGVVLSTNAVLVPMPANPAVPKLAVIGDSITNGTYLQYGGSHVGASIAQKLGMWDNLIVSGIGGTGWNTGTTAWSHANRIQDYIDYNADVYLFIGSQNDAAGAATQTAISTTLNALMAARPNAYVVGIGNIMGDSTTIANSIGVGYAAVTNQAKVRYLNNHTPAKWIPSADIAAWGVVNDLNHPSQAGMDRFAEIAATQVYASLMSMAV